MSSEKKKPVLIVGTPDKEVTSVIRQLEHRGAPYVCHAPRAPVTFTTSGSKTICAVSDNFEVTAENDKVTSPFRAVYFRGPLTPPVYHPDSDYFDRETSRIETFLDREVEESYFSLIMLLQLSGTPVYTGFGMFQKPVQLALLAAAGIPVPRSLITSDAGKVLEFSANQTKMIYKSVKGGQEVSVLSPDDLSESRLRLLKRAPVCFQNLVGTRDLRVYVADNHVIAAIHIYSDAEVDYRGRETRTEVVSLPERIRDAAIKSARLMGMRFAGIDIRSGLNDEFWILECNPWPMFGDLEISSGAPIAAGLASVMLGEMASNQA